VSVPAVAVLAEDLHVATQDVEVAIIGSGFAGLGMAIKLKAAGVTSLVILERADDIGGTWRDNAYPGCACDVPSHLYSFSFEPNPGWRRMYGTQPEIQAYLRHCADKYDLRPHLRVRSEVTGAAYDEPSARWIVHIADGTTVRAHILISGMGGLSNPSIPHLPGVENFRGVSFHSAQWNADYDLRGKRVAVVGTGASAIQFVPQIAPQVAELHLFQRTPPWILPKPDYAFDEKRLTRFERSPARVWFFRKLIYILHELRAIPFTMNRKLMRGVEKMAHAHIERQVADPALRRAVTPDYTIGCKRILISNDYYPTLARPNVELVTDAIAEVRADSIVTSDGRERSIDALIYGTGFKASEPIAPCTIRGVGGVELLDQWKSGIEAYLGITVAGFPNFFMLVGPNTGLGHNSMVFMIEAQVNYIMQCLRMMKRLGARTMNVRRTAESAFNRYIDERMKSTVWATGCKSWYLDANGRNITLWPASTVEYWMRTRSVRPSDYDFSKVS
jgi:cation diffusion facilitator CzcD-associated flavoprotein CzcO